MQAQKDQPSNITNFVIIGLKLECSKARIELGWRPKYSVRQALQHTVKWYRKFYEGDSPRQIKKFTLEQIEKYVRD